MFQETPRTAVSGWLMLPVTIALYALAIWYFIAGVQILDGGGSPWTMVCGIAMFILAIFLSIGHFILNPNRAGVIILFGNYLGTLKNNGFWWRNPLAIVKHISLRARNLNGDKLKVNDKMGNPIEIAAVVVWKVEDTAEAMFAVDDYENYVEVQSEAAVRHLAGRYPYDSGEEEVISLRSGLDIVSSELMKELQERLARAGVKVIEARISHLAYAPEIAGAMLRRQQAEAIIAARKRIVEGAVSMVEMALSMLSERKVVELDEERKASMVSNLLVVLCSEAGAQPVVNAGSLY